MTPANPPPPTAWNFPFQPDIGIHTSKLIAGVTFPTIRHAAGTGIGRGGCAVVASCAGGGVNGPAGTSDAEMIVVSGSWIERRPSHDAASAAAVRFAANKRIETMARALSENSVPYDRNLNR